ncbi:MULTISPECIES: potassium-transporting ATPase subunit F [Nostocales]|uniref:Potassium-transporting ATPase subunit F n=1 Tax=Dolichospermum heterosporum TAC447 TaxID=747523 RepID=A0ABY5LR23_9CYAN|nr:MULTISPECIES: potassium-transporting ATPase subunit F [Nostocales]MDK2409941.1 potassium-transporting ATPase subunit F [Aphanizomenon sp. 202]MDK2459838.1 potassium-transporting ATPase subunit F [Aphanizomenon sp. PH219]MBE9257264.1 potassium-transporting ATPase subunit F [Dolichospermum sp. LEGE 00246]MBO1066084.1 potassium-transporting ATPase subunit F [Anabaena sp. 54]UUO14408.1 potassium-transporting ATPase subunit F [Dolichospermum heterosporum TAC447]
MSPVVYANTTLSLDRVSTWAMGVLGFTTIMLVVYLLTVIFQPERF